mgnify:FL=1
MEEKDVIQPQNEEQNENVEVVANDNNQKQTAELMIEAKKEAVEIKKAKTKKKSKYEDLSEYEGLSDDELYAKIQTQKLLKKKQNKKIATIIGMGFAFVLAVVIIILAAVPVSLKPRCMVSGFDSVALYPGNTNGVSYTYDEQGYDDFMKVYNKAFSQPYISAIFSGSLFSYSIEENGDSVSSVIGSGGSLIQNKTYFVRLRYAEEQTFTYQNGRVYKSRYSNSKWPDGKLTFTDVYFEVSQTEGVKETKVYVVAKYPKFDGNDQVGTDEYIITITVKANTHLIYDAWSDLT